jgi:exodeoxyribonuclease VII large subunit
MDLFDFAKTNKPEEAETKKTAEKEQIFTVSEITTQVKQLIVAHFLSKGTFWIKGEISGYKGRNQAGHMYFKLKDENAVLSAVFFKFTNQKSKVELKEGLSVFVRGKLDVYEKSGSYQIIIEEIREEGAGDLYKQFEMLKKKLQEEGLFNPEHKKPIPQFPKTIGVITSSTGSVVKDIIHVVQARCPIVNILLFPVKVQGDGAADEISRAIDLCNKSFPQIEVLIVGRGGGSIEDLWSFNEEKVARSIFASKIPVISAVGHQTDFTIADFVADVRAATPSHAAEMIVPNLKELQAGLVQIMRHIVREISFKKDFYREKLTRFQRSPILLNPRNLVYQKIQHFDFLVEKFNGLMKRKYENARADYEKAISNLALVNPKAILSRGYSIVETKNRTIVRDSKQVQVQEDVTIHLHQGNLECRILKN